jgi:hypothetical protein
MVYFTTTTKNTKIKQQQKTVSSDQMMFGSPSPLVVM